MWFHKIWQAVTIHGALWSFLVWFWLKMFTFSNMPKKYLLCRPFVWLHPLEGFKRFQCPVQNLQSSINWFQSSCAWSSYLDLLLYACALCTQPNHTKRRFSNRLKTSLKENGFASEAGSTFHIQCCKVGVGRIFNLHVHIRIHVFLLLVIN